MRNISLENLFDIIVDSLGRMDKRLTGHGERVAYDMLLLNDPRFTDEETCRLTWIVLMHDIGNFKKCGINDLIKFESDSSFSHARYGYFFLKAFSPFPEFTPVVQYHHSGRAEIEASGMEDRLKWASECLQLFDTADLFYVANPTATVRETEWFLKQTALNRFSPQATKTVLGLLGKLPQAEKIGHDKVHRAVLDKLKKMEVTLEEKEKLLQTLVRSIDFRSHVTALHCSIAMKVSDMLAMYCGLSNDDKEATHIGAMLHDLGKIAMPVQILEGTGKLEGESWDIMRSHVITTSELLKGRVSNKVLKIAERHHEKLDGTGYPLGLKEDDLTFPQRIVAVGDIISALCEERSYKASFPLEKVLNILEDMASKNQICPKVVSVFREHKYEIYNAIREASAKTEAEYAKICDEYCADGKHILTE